MIRLLFPSLCLLITSGCARSAEQPQPLAQGSAPALVRSPVADAVDTLLNAEEDGHADPSTWKRLGRAATPHLVGILGDPAQGATRRGRAAQVLGFVAGPEEVALLERTAAGRSLHRLIRMGALDGLVSARRTAAVASLAPYLTDSEAGVRARCIDLLGQLGTPEALAALADNQATGTEADRLRVQRALRSTRQ